ncbi:MAG: glycosyltransferase family 2 protein [Rikenellaceae bacterium]
MYPKISFITVVYNDKEGLSRTLKNLCEAHYPAKELVVVDGGSTDGSVEVASQWAHAISYYVSERDGGIYDAMNKGIAASTGRFLWFVNAGDTIENIEVLQSYFATDNYLADIYYGDTLIVNEQGEELGLRRKPLPEKLTLGEFKNGMVICHQSFVMRRSLAPKYDTRYLYSADYKWMMECVRRAKSAINVHSVLSRFETGGATTANHKKSLRERFRIMRATFGLFTTLCYHLKFTFNALFMPRYR